MTETLYEIVMSIGTSLELDEMLARTLTVFLQKLNCPAGGFFLHETPEHFTPKLKKMVIPRIFAADEEYGRVSELVYDRIERIRTEEETPVFEPLQYRGSAGNIVILQIPRVGFMFLNSGSSSIPEDLLHALSAPLERLGSACIACFKSDELIKAQYNLEIRVSERTKQLEKSNNELKTAYEEIQNAQKQLIHNEKMVSIGQLAAGVAHEINNPTGFISSNLHTLIEYFTAFAEFYTETEVLIRKAGAEETRKLRELEEREDLEFIIGDCLELINESIDGAERIKKIVSGLRKFARTDNSDPEPADINSVLKDAVRLTWNELKYKCELEEKYSDLPEISCRADQLTQVFVNILVNAAQAIESQGTVSIETRGAGKDVEIRIRDTGTGIPPENLNKLFDPFFTTKEIGKGTGLGLSISHGIIEKHNGSITVDSTPGTGTCFTIRLPIKQP